MKRAFEIEIKKKKSKSIAKHMLKGKCIAFIAFISKRRKGGPGGGKIH